MGSTRTSLLTLLVAVLTAALLIPAQPASADHGPESHDIVTLKAKLSKAMRAYNNAKGRLKTSRKRQKKLDKEIKDLESKMDSLSSRVGRMASAAYRGNRADTVSVLLESSSPRDLAHSMTTVEYLAHRDYKHIQAYKGAQDRLARKRYQLELEMRKQRVQLKKMKKRKKEALAALIKAGGGDPTGGPDGGAPTAEPSPRAPDGSWPPEGCTQDDPTTSGCLTPRTLHALQEAREAGYTRYTKCWRQASSGEHPKGRACDMSASSSGFENRDAYGGDKQYGDNLAGWFVANANALGVMYVIWYRRIWQPGSGWSSYNGGGSPSGDHTNHVHVSIQ